MSYNGQHGPFSLVDSVTRREFVKTTATVAAILPFVGTSLAVARSAYAGGADTLKIALIGCGGRGTGAAMQALTADKGAVLWTMADVFKDRIDASYDGLKKEIEESAKDTDLNARSAKSAQLQVDDSRKFVGFDSFQRAIDSGVDVVLITGYPAFRPEHLKAAVAAGKHVFAEKPVAVDAPGIRSVIESSELAKAKNTALVVGFCWRHHPGMNAAMQYINSGAFGEVVTAHTTYNTGTLGNRPRKPEWTDLEFQMRNWWHFTWISGDHIVEQAIHSVDRLSWAMNDLLPTRVICHGGRAARTGPESGNVFDHFSAVYEYPNGKRAFHSCRQIDQCINDNSDYVYSGKGLAIVDGWKDTAASIRDFAGKEVWKPPASPSGSSAMYQNEHDELFASIRSGKPINDGVRSSNSTMLAIMARMAAYTGQAITWEQAMKSQEKLVPDKIEFGPMPTPAVAVPGQTKFL